MLVKVVQLHIPLSRRNLLSCNFSPYIPPIKIVTVHWCIFVLTKIHVSKTCETNYYSNRKAKENNFLLLFLHKAFSSPSKEILKKKHEL